MPDVAGDPAGLELLRVQRSRLADRMRWPWWYQSGLAFMWALTFACPFSSRFLPRGLAPGLSWPPGWRWPACCSGACPGPPA
jgi:hypothetical protein